MPIEELYSVSLQYQRLCKRIMYNFLWKYNIIKTEFLLLLVCWSIELHNDRNRQNTKLTFFSTRFSPWCHLMNYNLMVQLSLLTFSHFRNTSINRTNSVWCTIFITSNHLSQNQSTLLYSKTRKSVLHINWIKATE